MIRRDRELLRPEDARSWEEFQARCTVAQAQSRAANSSWRAIGQAVFLGLFVIVVIFFWYGFAHQAGGARWVWFVAALLVSYLEIRVLSKLLRRGIGASKRYTELSKLRKQWQARAERGEIPMSTPGGLKVWRDELDPQAG